VETLPAQTPVSNLDTTGASVSVPGLQTGGKAGVPPVTLDPGPGDQYTTIYRPYTGAGTITVPTTVITIAPSGG
jgi:hypothetical protein